MTWAWRIYSSLLIAMLALPLGAATLKGRVELIESGDPGRKPPKNSTGVVVWLEPEPATSAAPPAPASIVTMRQTGKRFTPHVLAIQAGTTVDFPNDDPIFHNAFSSFDGQIFDIGLYPPGTSRQVVFRRPGVVRVFCNIHPMMSAVIAVVPTPWFGVTDPGGEFRIEDVPAGQYRLRVFHERALPATLAGLGRTLTLGADDETIETIRISESGYVAAPHRNKYGRDYPPQTDEYLVYPGVKK